MSKALLVDYGGVLTTSVLDSFAAFARAEGIDPSALFSVMRGIIAQPDNLFHRVERGEIETDVFEVAFSAEIERECGVAPSPKGLKSRLFAGAGADENMMDVVRAARSHGVRTALVSNSWGVVDGGYPMEEFNALFDATIISGEVGLRKPQPEIYLLASSRIDVAPKDCVFVDDFAVNVEGAQAVGMTGIQHRSHVSTIPELEAFLAVPLKAP